MTPFTSAEDLFRREGTLEEKIASLLAERDQLQADLETANNLADGMQVSRPADPPSPRAAEGAEATLDDARQRIRYWHATQMANEKDPWSITLARLALAQHVELTELRARILQRDEDNKFVRKLMADQQARAEKAETELAEQKRINEEMRAALARILDCAFDESRKSGLIDIVDIARAALAGDRSLVVRQFTNELGNRIKITIEGPGTVSENILTPMEARELHAALSTPTAGASDGR